VFEYVKTRGEPVSRGTITQAIKGRKQYVVQAIDCLIEEGPLEEIPGARGAKLIQLSDVPGTFPEQMGTRNEGTTFPVPLSIGNGNAERREEAGDDIPF
jgi:hypothetical protein